MTSSTSRTLRKAGAVALSLALAMSTLAVTPAEAAAKVKLAKTKITVKVGKTKKVKVKGVKAKQVKKITVKSSKKAVAVAKKVSKVKIKVTGKKKGTATVKVNLKLKKKVGGKKKYNLKLAVTVKKAAATPTEAPVVTPVPTQAPVVTGQGISMVKKTETVSTGQSVVLTAQLTPADSNDVVEWSVLNPAIASVTPASDASGSAATLVASGAAAAVAGKAYAKVTGLTEGTTQVTAKVGNYTDVCTVTVTKTTVVATLQSVKQPKADTVELTFDIDTNKSTNKITKDQIEVNLVNADKKVTGTIPVNELKVSADGKIITAVLANAFTDKGTYQIGYNGVYKDLTASVGAVTSVALLSATAEVNVATKIEYALYDANGVDVTSAHVLNTECEVESTGDGVLDGTSANKTITFDTVGQKAEVTITYTNSATTPATTVPGKGTITCVAATAKVGTARFKMSDDLKDWGGEEAVAKFYSGSDSDVKVKIDDTKTFYFFAEKDGKAIQYEEYEVESANSNIATAEVAQNGGRYVAINVTGGTAGKTVNINVKATVNGKTTPYVVPVSVVAEPTLKSVSLSFDKTTLTNAADEEYFADITAKAIGSDGSEMNNVDVIVTLLKGPNGEIGSELEGFFSPAGVDAGTYTIKAEAEYDGVTKSSTKTITVKACGADFESSSWSYTGKIAYGVESPKTLTLSSDASANVRIFAKNGDKFLGYVRYDSTGDVYNIGGDETYGALNYSTATGKISNISVTVQHGNYALGDTSTTSGEYATFTLNGLSETGYTSTKADGYEPTGYAPKVVLLYSNTLGSVAIPDIIEGNSSYDLVWAKEGTTTVKFAYSIDGSAVKTPLTANIKVTRGFTAPVITVEKSKIDNLSEDSVIEALYANVDMNSPGTTHDSIKAANVVKYALKTWKADEAGMNNNESKTNSGKQWVATVEDFSKNNATVNYAVVEEDDMFYAVPVGTTFSEA